MSYLLNIQISAEDLKLLVDRGFNLCLTQGFAEGDVEFQGNVAFDVVPNRALAPFIRAEWQAQYQIYMTHTFKPGGIAKAETKTYNINHDQRVQFDKDGTGVHSYGVPGTLGFENNWGNGGRAGINVRVLGDLPYENFATTYISHPTPLGAGGAFRPVDTAGVFFSQEYKEADTMIDPDTDIFRVVFQRGTAATIAYSNGQWKQLPM